MKMLAEILHLIVTWLTCSVILALIVMLVLSLVGCASRSEEQRQEQTDSDSTTQAKGTLHANGTIGMPLPGSVPMQVVTVPWEVVIERRETATTSTASEATSKAQVRTEIDGEAIGRQIGTIASTAITAAIDRLVPTMIAGHPAPGTDWGGVLTAALTAATTGAGAIAVMQRKATRVQEKRAEEHKADADKGWEKALEK
jgi:uncharacterized protein YceK